MIECPHEHNNKGIAGLSMAEEGFELEDWDADFLNQVFQAEELLLSSTTQPPRAAAFPPPTTTAPPPYGEVNSFSPPRELSQRVIVKGVDHTSDRLNNISSDKDDEINRLKEELGRVSKQLTHLDQECAELRKERDSKEEQLQSVYSRSRINDAELRGRDSKFSDPQTSKYQEAKFTKERGGSIIKDIPTCKAAGVQTDNDEHDNSNAKCHHDSCYLSNKLFSVWYPSELQVVSNIVLKLMVSCEADIRELLGSVNANLQHKGNDSVLVEPMMASGDPQDSHSDEAVKILHFHSTLTRFSEGLVKVVELLESLVALCRLKNVSIVSRSLHILHTLLMFSVSLRRTYERRDDVVIETSSSDNVADELKSSLAGRKSYAKGKEIVDQSCNLHCVEPCDDEVPRRKYSFDCSSLVSFDQINWMALFQLMCQIASSFREEYARQEAVSIMNIIVMRSNPYSDREKFISEELFRSFSELLKEKAGLAVQTQSVHLLYLLLSCPKILSWFCTTCREELERAGKNSDIGDNSISASPGCHMMFEGLADCISCSGLGSQELRLRRNAIILLAFLASSGTCGVQIMFGSSTSKKFLLLSTILRGLAAEIDLEAKEPARSAEIYKERTLLMRETLILLNGLVSYTQYCGPVLRALTSPREMLCLTASIANRLAVKANCPWKDDSMTTQIRELEVLELARVFRKRVFSYLGRSIS